MVTQPILERKKNCKRLIVWESSDTIWGTMLPLGASRGGLKNGVKFWPALFRALTQFCAGQTLRDVKNRRKTTIFTHSKF